MISGPGKSYQQGERCPTQYQIGHNYVFVFQDLILIHINLNYENIVNI